MSDNNGSGLGAGVAIGLGIGIMIGGFFAFLILRSQKTVTEAQALQQAIPHVPVYPPSAYYQPPPLIIREVQQQPQIQSIAPVLQPAVQMQTMEPAPAATSYKNNEDWEITRGEDGRIKKMKVIRDARATKA